MPGDNYGFELQSLVELSSGEKEDVRRSILGLFEALANDSSALCRPQGGDAGLVLDGSEARTILDFDPARNSFLILPELKWLSGSEATSCRLMKVTPTVQVELTQRVLEKLAWADRKSGIMKTNAQWLMNMIQNLLADPAQLDLSPLGMRRYLVRELVKFRIRAVVYIESRRKIRIEDFEIVPSLV